MSFQPVKGEKSKPIIPRSRIIKNTSPLENMTTSQLSYTHKKTDKRSLMVPSSNITKADQPIENKTTTALSFVNPGPISQQLNFKPKTVHSKYLGNF